MEHRAWTEIDLAAIAHNLETLKKVAGPARILVVLKADAYGHGAVRVARLATEHGAAFLGVGDSGEAMELRQAGVAAKILVLGSLIAGEVEPMIAHDVTICVHSAQKIQLLSRIAQALKKKVRVHLKVDTGMGRMGVLPSRALDLVREIASDGSLELEGLCTHLASTAEDDPQTGNQMELFAGIVREAESLGFNIPYRHAANSLGMLRTPSPVLNLARPGIAVYGLVPGSSRASDLGLKPALSLKSQVIFLKDLPEGSTVGYQRTFTTDRPTRIAILPIGYNDGYRFALSNRAQVLVRERRAKVIGRVSMDYATVDVTDIPGVQVGDEAVLIGRQGAERISTENLASWAQTIPYEVLCGIGKRVRRVYKECPDMSHET